MSQTRQDDLAVSIGEASSEKQNDFINASVPVFALQPHEQDTPDLTIGVEGANNIVVGGELFAPNAQDSPSFTPPVSGTEIHLLYAYNNSGTLTLAIKTTDFTGGDPSTYDVEFPIAEVSLTLGQTTITYSNITDVRLLGIPQDNSYIKSQIYS